MSDQIVCSGGCERETVEIRREVVLSSKVFAEADVPIHVGNMAEFLSALAKEVLAETADPEEGDDRPVVAADFNIRVRFMKANRVVEVPNTFTGTEEEALAIGWEKHEEGGYICPECIGRVDPTLAGGTLTGLPQTVAEEMIEEEQEEYGDDEDLDEDGELGGGYAADEEDTEEREEE